MKRVLDASVIIKWFVAEPESSRALSYLQDFLKGKFDLVVPTLLFYDASYAVLADKHNCPLITADKKLFQKLKDRYQQIALL